jgi:hypothetical protein
MKPELPTANRCFQVAPRAMVQIIGQLSGEQIEAGCGRAVPRTAREITERRVQPAGVAHLVDEAWKSRDHVSVNPAPVAPLESSHRPPVRFTNKRLPESQT